MNTRFIWDIGVWGVWELVSTVTVMRFRLFIQITSVFKEVRIFYIEMKRNHSCFANYVNFDMV